MTHPAHPLHAVPDSPPPEVLAQIAAADATYERLITCGRRVHFDLHPDTAALAIQLLDDAGDEVSVLTPRDVLEILAGADTQ